MAELAYPLPARVICELFGVPKDDEAFVVSKAPALGVGLDATPFRTPEAAAAADEATRALSEYIDGLIAERRRHPDEDLLSALIAAEEGGDRLSHEELVATVLLVLVAGHETTANLIGNSVLALLQAPDVLADLRQDRDVDHTAVDELLRREGPIQMVRRVTLEEVTIAGVTIPPGRIVVPLIAAANHDPADFSAPERLDLRRDPNPHLAFGGGIHYCLGASLARMEGRIVIGALCRRFPNLRVLVPPRWRRSFTIRGLDALHVALR